MSQLDYWINIVWYLCGLLFGINFILSYENVCHIHSRLAGVIVFLVGCIMLWRSVYVLIVTIIESNLFS